MKRNVQVFRMDQMYVIESGDRLNYVRTESGPLPVDGSFPIPKVTSISRHIIKLERYKRDAEVPFREIRYCVLDDDWLEEAWFDLRKDRDSYLSMYMNLSRELDHIYKLRWWERFRFLFTNKLSKNRPKMG